MLIQEEIQVGSSEFVDLVITSLLEPLWLLDLGVSSPQLDTAERGFSFGQDGPLDMRMDRRQGLTAEQIVNESSAGELARIFWEFGDEPKSRQIANRIVRLRKAEPVRTTAQVLTTRPKWHRLEVLQGQQVLRSDHLLRKSIVPFPCHNTHPMSPPFWPP